MTKLNFHRPGQADKVLLDQINNYFTPYADTAYGTLITWWDFYDDLYLAEINGNIVVKSSYPFMGERVAYSLIGAHQASRTLKEIFTWLHDNNIEKEMHFVPEYVVETIKDSEGSSLSFKDDPDIAEYVLLISEQISLSGKVFTHLRYKKNLFTSLHGHAIKTYEIDLTLSKNRDDVLDAVKSWKPRTDNDTDKTEMRVIKRSLEYFDQVETRVFLVEIDGRKVAAAFFKLLANGHVNVNHIKVDYEYRHVFTYTVHALAQHLSTNYGSIYMNIEQDLGIAGLRHFKQLQRPSKMLKKYTIVSD